ncbi:MAG TPA: FAD-binding oxidoreductase [Gaiellaceae bacterium]|nr:FAD-binding oxidoreductase [Gaiellaceae bacterium]
MAQLLRTEAPASPEAVAALLREAKGDGLRVRVRGGGTKLGWGAVVPEPDLELSTSRLDRIVEHNAGDLTAVLEAGVRLAEAQAAFAEAGQMLALDPPLATGSEASSRDGGLAPTCPPGFAGATIGGIVATADAGPLRHRYGAVRDLLLGITVALSDGTVATAGGKVIKNVAGYDLAKLFAGSFGTLGVILRVVVRLHPRPRTSATLAGETDDPGALARAASHLARAPLELEALDVRWAAGSGTLLARFGGVSAETQARRRVGALAEEGLAASVETEDETVWETQRAAQRSTDGVVVRVSALPTELERVVWTADRLGASLVGRAAAGVSWLTLADAEPVDELRAVLAPFPCVVLDAPVEVRDRIDPWGAVDEAELRLMRRVKERFDPAHILNPGVFVGGI